MGPVRVIYVGEDCDCDAAHCGFANCRRNCPCAQEHRAFNACQVTSFLATLPHSRCSQHLLLMPSQLAAGSAG